jgi:Protein of unknown function (DUF1573)
MIPALLVSTALSMAAPSVDTNRSARAPFTTEPERLVLKVDQYGFATSKLVVRNNTSDTARITSIKGSCGCAAANVQQPVMPPGGTGMVLLMINAKNADDVRNELEYVISLSGGRTLKTAVLVSK